MYQDGDTGEIRYSFCNGDVEIPQLPRSGSLSLSHVPKRGSSLAADGFREDTARTASIFYQDEQDNIIEAQLQCDLDSGHWTTNAEKIVSQGLPASAQPARDTGLTAARLGSNTGWRLYYHSSDGRVHSLGHMRNLDWSYWGAVSQDVTSSRVLAIANKGNADITVAVPKDQNNIGISHQYFDVWHVGSVPRPFVNADNNTNVTVVRNLQLNTTAWPQFTLPAWDGSAAGLGVTIDKDAMRSIFYVGNDRAIHRLKHNSSTPEGDWHLDDTANASWPRADQPSASLTVAGSSGDRSAIRLYYVTDGRLSEVNGDGDVWLSAQALPVARGSGWGSGSGLSRGTKAGIGVGAGVGAIIIAVLIYLFGFRRWRRKSGRKNTASPTKAPSKGELEAKAASEPPALTLFAFQNLGGAGNGRMHEKEGDSPLVEMESPGYLHEMPATSSRQHHS